MLYFERTYSCYYFFYVKLRKIIKNRDDEDIAALFPFTLSLMLPILAFIFFFLKLNHLSKTTISPVTILLIIWIPFTLSYFYFVSNRKRRNRIIDDYRYLSKRAKLFWQIISILNLIIPFILIIVIINRHW